MSGKTLGFRSKKYFNPKILALKISKYFIYKFTTILNAKYFTAMGCEICLQFEFEVPKFSIALRSGPLRSNRVFVYVLKLFLLSPTAFCL